ncbi:Hypothetical protein A7982_05511 [Minicystis rosea]|nr:Hypothetical protein A7982_05511 [Minicystis rosea]
MGRSMTNGGSGILGALLLAALAAAPTGCGGTGSVTSSGGGSTSSSGGTGGGGGACASGLGDCDADTANGCETPLTTLTDCGGCGVACALTNAVASCTGGTCRIASCAAGFFDCDADASNGCEATACSPGATCTDGNGCDSGVCKDGVCQAATCTDEKKNDAETDVDCGGDTCPACATDATCAKGSDCASGVCKSGVCQAATCTDEKKNGAETDVDCGGGTCPACETDASCINAADCASAVCINGICQAATCTDGVQNQGETGLDCGGPCSGCALGQPCVNGTDCASGTCIDDTCQLFGGPVCHDGKLNGAETGLDCGGCACAPCADGLGCRRASDCQTGVCLGGVCRTPTCFDDVKNGNETGIDCGGDCGACQSASTPVVISTLLHFDSNLSDASGKVVTRIGAGDVTTMESRFGGGAMYFDGATYLELGPSQDFDFGDGDFTVEYWFKELPPHLNYEGFVELFGSSTLNVIVGAALLSPVYDTTGAGVSETSFDHYAIVRRGDTLRTFRNGVWRSTTSYTGTVGAATDKLRIGLNNNNTQYLSGYLDELRVTKGLARYTSDFSPPTKAFSLGESCTVANDCPSSVCAAGICAASSCADGVRNGAETDVDCGGDAACSACATGRACVSYADCVSGICEGGICRPSGDVVLLHFDGADGSTVFTEATGKPVLRTGNGAIQSANVKFGTGAAYFDGATKLTIPVHHSFDFRCGDFTVEYWFKEVAPQSNYEGFFALASGTLYIVSGTMLISPVYYNPVMTLDATSFQHYAIVRSGSTLNGYYKGKQVYSTPYDGACGDAADALIIGYNPNNNQYMTGYLDEVRITKGMARYTSDFVPPAAAFTYP